MSKAKRKAAPDAMKAGIGTLSMRDVFRMPQEKLHASLAELLASRHDGEVLSTPDFVYKQGTCPVLLVAHMDTVHKDAPTICTSEDGGLWMAPEGIGGDDRCGIWIVLNLLETHNCHVLFTRDEEIGGTGASAFAASGIRPAVRFIAEFDRTGNHDAVFYDCGNAEFIRFVTKTTGYKEAWGTFSDISIIAPELDVAAVNLSSGYYSAHQRSEFVVLDDMQAAVEAGRKLLQAADTVQTFDHQEVVYSGKWSGCTGSTDWKRKVYGGDYDDDPWPGTSGRQWPKAPSYMADALPAGGTPGTSLTESEQKMQDEQDASDFADDMRYYTEQYLGDVLGYVPDSTVTDDISELVLMSLSDYGLI